jgi:hypothetical protein
MSGSTKTGRKQVHKNPGALIQGELAAPMPSVGEHNR